MAAFYNYVYHAVFNSYVRIYNQLLFTKTIIRDEIYLFVDLPSFSSSKFSLFAVAMYVIRVLF